MAGCAGPRLRQNGATRGEIDLDDLHRECVTDLDDASGRSIRLTAVHESVAGALIRGNTGRRGSADEQADAIVCLASDPVSFINGAVVPVDDGWAAV